MPNEPNMPSINEKQKVLIVDDEPRNQRIVSESLDDLAELQVASTGEETLKVVDTFLPDLILLDVMMPGIDGYEVCRKIRANPNLTLTKVILVSGKAMIEERLKGYECGADDYMTKPFVPEELLAKTKVFLRLSQLEKQLNEVNRSLDKKVQERTQQLLETEAKLVNAAKMSALGEMAGGIAHEINTPLGVIGMVADQVQEMISEETVDRQAVAKMVLKVSETVQRIGAIIKGLRTFSRDGSRERFDSVPVKQIIDSTVALCGEKFKSGGIELQIDPIPPELCMQCRTVQMSQVMLNLLNNACDAIQPLSEKWIRIAAAQRGNEVEISVTDSGPGIPETVRIKLFQPFFTTKEIGKGTGLGLSISKGIMDAHHGSLSVDDQCKNTRFVLLLPMGLPKDVAKIA